MMNTDTTDPSRIKETDDWKLGCFIDWRPKDHTETCTDCNGAREVGGGFKSLDGPVPCPMCHGRGFMIKGPSTQMPEIPPALIEHMRRAWWDYFNTPCERNQNHAQ